MASKSALTQLNDLIGELELLVKVEDFVELPSEPVKEEKTSNKKAKKKGGASDDSAKPSTKTEAPQEKDDSETLELTINAIDLRVGVIRKVWRHETAEKLYCEEIDVGEDSPRLIASGLVPYYSLGEMEGRKLIAVCNLKPRNLVGFKSHGMVLCASNGSQVEFIDPPVDSKPGDRVFGFGLTAEPLSAKQVDKRKAFETVAPDLKVNSDGVAVWKDLVLRVAGSESPCTAPTLRDSPIH